MTGGNPTPIFEILKGTDSVKSLYLLQQNVKHKKRNNLGADAVMVVGQEGGGHLGRDDVGTMVLVPQVVDGVSIPVIAIWRHWRWSWLDGCPCARSRRN